MRSEKYRRKDVLVVGTLFESLGPLGLWVSVLAGGPYNIRRARAWFDVKSSEKALLLKQRRV